MLVEERVKQVYDKVKSLSKTFNRTEEDFGKSLQDERSAKALYEKAKTKYGVNLLDAPDVDSFLDSLNTKPKDVQTEVVESSVKKYKLPDYNKGFEAIQDTIPSMQTKAPKAQISDTLDMGLNKTGLDFVQSDYNPVKKALGVDSVRDYMTPQEKIRKQIDSLGEDVVMDKTIADNLHADIDSELKRINDAYGDFLMEYESKQASMTANGSAPWSPAMPAMFGQRKKYAEYLDKNKALYDEIHAKQKALYRQKELVDSYKELADVDKSIAVREQLSSMVSNGEISENTMNVLRSNIGQMYKEDHINRLVNDGSISQEVADKVLAMGDWSDKATMARGFTSGRFEDIASLGMNEIARNIDVINVMNRIKRGEQVSEEEKSLALIYSKLSQMNTKEKADKRDWQYGFGQMMQKSLMFVAEMALTGGVSSSTKTLGAKGFKSIIDNLASSGAKHITAKAMGEAAKQTIKLAGKGFMRQAKLSAITPTTYVDFTGRLANRHFETNDKLTVGDYAKNMYLSWASTTAERYSETLFNIFDDIPLATILTKGKATKGLLTHMIPALGQITGNDKFQYLTDMMKAVGVHPNIINEIGSEVTSVLMESGLTLDKEKLQELSWGFVGQVALQSIIMSGMGSLTRYTVGGASAAFANKEAQRAFDRSMEIFGQMPFSNNNLNALKDELMNAISNERYIQDGKSSDRTVADILNEMDTIVREGSYNKQDRAILGFASNAAKNGAYRYGQMQAVKSYVESKIGEFEHEDGNVYEVTDSQGNTYFMLDNTEDVVVLRNKVTGEKLTKPKSYFQEGSITQTNGTDWAINTLLTGVDAWNTQALQEQIQQRQDDGTATYIMLSGQRLPVVRYDAKSGNYIVANPADGTEMPINPNDKDVIPLYPENTEGGQPQADMTDNAGVPLEVEQESEVEQDDTDNIDNIDNTEQEQVEELKYSEDGEPIWQSASVERGKQEIDSAFDAEEAISYVNDKVKEAKKALEKANNKKAHSTNLTERKAENERIKAEKEDAQKALDYWNQMKSLYEAVAKEEAPQQQDTLNVVDDSRDTPADARARGFKMINGIRYDRQTEMKSAKYGNDKEVKFADKVFAKAKIAVVEASEAQPSHMGGQENPLHFMPEAQPKARVDAVSVKREDDIARNMNPQEITGGATAYTGSPSLNQVGEAIQGNSRLAALKRMYEQYPEKAKEYKQYLIDHAAEWGLNPQDIASMQAPILVNVLDVTEQQAIELGQKTAQDIESGGKQAIAPQNVAQQLGKDMKTFAGILLRTDDEDVALDDVVNANGYNALKYLTQKKVITETQLQTALDEKGNITPEARQALKDILSQIIFKDGNKNIRAQFAKLPKTAQKALLQTIARELDSAEGEGILKDIQEAIEVYNNLLNDKDFVEAKGVDAVQNAVNLWAKQIQMDFTEGNFVPEDRYSNFAIALAVSFKVDKMKEQAAKLNQLYDYLQQEGGDIFNPAVKLSKEEAVKEVYGVELNNKKQDETNEQSGDSISIDANQESGNGRPTSTEGVTDVGQSEQDLGQTDSQGAVGDSQTRVSEKKRTRVTGPLSEEEYKEYQSKLDEIDAQIEKADTPNQALIDERSRLFYNFLRRITNESFSVVSENDFREIMEDYGISQEDINYIAEKYHDPEIASAGIYAEGQIFFFTENIKSIEDLRLTLVHERQHRLTLENWNYYYNEVTSRVDSVDELKSNLVALSGINEYNNRTKDDMDELVGEFISYAMMYVYTGKKYPNRFKELGLNEKLINFIKEIDYEQRGYEGRVRINQGVRNQEWYSDLFRSRRGSAQEDIDDENIAGAIQQNERDTPPGYSNVDEQGDRTSSTSGEGTQRAESSKQIEITEELIDSLPVDDLVKLYAKQYLNGKQNTVTRSAYQTIKDYVQNESRVGTGYSSNADTAQLGSRTDDATVQSMGTDGEQSGPVDRGQSNGVVSTERPSGEDSQGSLFSVPGEESNNGVEQEASNDSDISSDNSRGSSRGRRKGSDVRKSGRSTSGSRVSADVGRGDSASQQSIDDKIKSADDLISDALAEIEDILKNSANTVGALGNAEMFKLIPATAKLGYALTKKGFYTFQKWFAQMQKHIGPLLQKHLTVEEVDEFIRDMWDTDFPFNGETHTVSEWASMVEQEELRKMVRMSLEEKIALQKSKENVETIVEDLDNIRESLPFLLPQQQEDVLKAETQFFSQSHKSRKYGNGKGIMFTNGTGTGKTYTGLGIVKRFVKQGKGRILIVTAQDKKIKDWIRDASNLGIEATQLKDTKDKGKGVVVTQFANMYQNRALLEEEWDLIVYDESHKLMESKDGRLTARAVMHHMLSNRDIEQAVRRHLRDHELFKKEYELRDELEYLNELYGKNLKELSQEDRDNFDKLGGIDGIKRRIDSINSELDTIKVQQDNLVKQTLKDENALEKAKKSVDNTKVVFLSASPFNTAKNLDYVESYIFSYNPEASNEFDGERLPSELREGDRNNFVLEKFPSSHFKLGNGSVQMRSEQQITNPEQSSQEEVDFSESLQDLGTLSGRTLDSEWDYSRQFPRFNFSQAETFNRMYDALQRGKYAPLMQYFKIFTEYNLYTEYFEAIKTSLSLDRIRQHVELGRKVVVFHRRRSNSTKGGFVGTPVNDSIAEAQIQEQDHRKLMEEFEIEFADYLAWEKEANLDFANYQITEAFATDEEKAQYQEDLKKWRKKVEEAKLKGTKKVPDRPTMKTKTVVTFNGSLNEKEKRENADAFNNPNSDAKVIVVQVASGKEGVDLHDTTGKFQRAEINLYLPESPIEFIQAEGRIYRIGNKSNAIFEYPLLGIDLELAAFAMKINGRAQTSENLALGKQSRGLRDSISRAALSSRPIPVSNQQGIGGKQLDSKQEQKKEDFDDAIRNYDEWRDKQSDILEEKQVPDPIGERMTVWAMPEGGDTVLVPFAGEGSVARYVDTKARLVAYEPSMAKYSRLAMLCGGSGRKIENKEYLGEERYYNDNILYFKPYGDPKVEVNGISHAIYRLSDSGRMIVLTTSGDMLRERLANKYSFDESIITRAQIKLPTSVMGINKNNLEIIVIDKLADKELQNQAKGDTLQLDFSNITNETELWEALRGVQMPERIIDNVAKTRKRAEKALDNYIASSPLVKKRTEYSANGKNKLVPKIYKSNFECSFEMKVEGYNAFRYANFTKGNPKYSPRNVEALARAWDSRQEAIKNLEKNTDKYSIERVEAYKTMCNFIEALLDKTPPQLRNLARGISENVVTGQIDVPTLKDTIKGMLGGNAALERLNDRVMKVAEAFGLEVEIVSENHPKFSGKSRGVQGFYSLNDNKIWIKEEYINSVRVSDEKKAEVLLHEAIHAVTSHALSAYQNGLINENSPLYKACNDIAEVYEAIKDDPTFVSLIKGKDGIDAANNEYGLSDVHEMMAELANPAFRAALKAKKLWRQVINGIKRILGIQIPGVESEQTDALNVLENALEVLLDNLDVNTFNRYKSAGLFSKMEFNYKTDNSANDALKLGNLTDNDGNRFYEKNGSIDLWDISRLLKEARRQIAPVRLTDRNVNHILKSHNKEFKNNIQNVLNFIDDVFKNATVMHRARAGAMYVVVENPKTDKAAIIKLYPSEYGDYYNVETAGYYRKSMLDKKDEIARLSEPELSDSVTNASKPQQPQINGEEALNTKAAITSYDKGSNNSDNTIDDSQKSSKLYRQSSTPLETRQHSEEVMREKIDGMADVFGVTPEYIYDEKNTNQKGWYEPATGKVVVNLAAHATIDDARQTYLHEVVGHFGLRGLLKDKFEQVMEQVFNSLPKEVQDKYLSKYGSKDIAAEEYLSQMAEMDIEPNLIAKLIGFVREALRAMGVNLNNYSNADMQYLLWRSKNNLKANPGYIEVAKWGAKDLEIRRRIYGKPKGYQTNDIKMTRWERLLYERQDLMRPVKKIVDEMINRGGAVKESSDVLSQGFLSTSRAGSEVEDFDLNKLAPMARAFGKAINTIANKFNISSETAQKQVYDYLFARHAPERNKQICLGEIINAAKKAIKPDKANLVNAEFLKELERLAGLIYDNQFANGKNMINPQNVTAEQAKLLITLAGVMSKEVNTIANFYTKDANGKKVYIGNNRSGMNDVEAATIINKLYDADTKAVFDELSARVKECTDFTLDKWLEYELISQEEYDTYKKQYKYYIPLRGWEEKGEDIDYSAIPAKQRTSSGLLNLNRRAEGRWSRAENPISYIQSMAISACVTGNRNLIRRKAFNLILENHGNIGDLASFKYWYEVKDEDGNVVEYTPVAPSQDMFDKGLVKRIPDMDYLWHKTKDEKLLHEIVVMIDGKKHSFFLHGEIGAFAATSINGNIQDTRSEITRLISKGTRIISANLTGRNIYFIFKNMIRDIGFGNFAYFIESGLHKTLKMNGNYLSAMRIAALDAAHADVSKMKPEVKADYDLYQEYKLNGGQTGYIQLREIDKLTKDFDKLLNKVSGNTGTLENSAEFVLNTLNILGKASENAMRFAVYKTERQMGASPREAAIRAKEITVNFNKAGAKKGLSSIYAFFNPAVQGAYRYAKLFKEYPQRALATTFALMAMKFGLNCICEALLGGDDDENKGETAYDRLSDYVKATNWVIPLNWLPGERNDDEFLCIPLPQSVRASTYFSDCMTEVMFGRKSIGEAFGDFALFGAGEFVPFDIDAFDFSGQKPVGSLIQMITPTVARPIIEAYVVNRDFMGNPVSKEPYLRDQNIAPQSEMAFNSTSKFFVGVSEVLNKIAGGNKTISAGVKIAENGQVEESGLRMFMDINPARIQHVLKGWFGGMVEPLFDTYDIMTSALDENKDIDINTVPMINQIVKGPTSKPGYKTYYQMRDEAELIMKVVKMKEDNMEYDEDYIDVISNKYNTEIVEVFHTYSQIINDLNKQIMSLKTNSSRLESIDDIQKLDEKRNKLILEAAKAYREICKQRDKDN